MSEVQEAVLLSCQVPGILMCVQLTEEYNLVITLKVDGQSTLLRDTSRLSPLMILEIIMGELYIRGTGTQHLLPSGARSYRVLLLPCRNEKG